MARTLCEQKEVIRASFYGVLEKEGKDAIASVRSERGFKEREQGTMGN